MSIKDPVARRLYQRNWRRNRKAEAPPRKDRRVKFDWEEISGVLASGLSRDTCREKYGITAGTWYAAVRRGDVPRAARRGRSLDEMVSIRSRSLRGQLKRKLISSGVLPDCCAICGLRSWMGKGLVLILDHVNGVNDDNALHNLRFLCPNCNSQTATFSGRNMKKRNIHTLGSRQAA